jgi:hypothetical protein
MFFLSFFNLQTVAASVIRLDETRGGHALPSRHGDDSGKRSAWHQSWLVNQLFSDSVYQWRSLELSQHGPIINEQG